MAWETYIVSYVQRSIFIINELANILDEKVPLFKNNNKIFKLHHWKYQGFLKQILVVFESVFQSKPLAYIKANLKNIPFESVKTVFHSSPKFEALIKKKIDVLPASIFLPLA